MKRPNFSMTLAIAVSALLLAAPLVHAATDLPPTQHGGGIDYVTGGIGSDESTAIRQASRSWPLTLEFAVQDGQRAGYAADVAVELRDAHHRALLKLRSDGPFVLAKVPPGRYTVDATLNGKTLHQAIMVSADRPAKAVYLWRNTTGTAPF